MVSHFIADFPTLLQSAEATLLKMKAALDAYKKKPDANAAHVEIREKQLLDLVRLTQACNTFLQQSAAEQDAIYRMGIQRGLDLAAEEEKHELSPHWQSRKYFHSPQDKESYRWEQNARSYSRWADHY